MEWQQIKWDEDVIKWMDLITYLRGENVINNKQYQKTLRQREQAAKLECWVLTTYYKTITNNVLVIIYSADSYCGKDICGN